VEVIGWLGRGTCVECLCPGSLHVMYRGSRECTCMCNVFACYMIAVSGQEIEMLGSGMAEADGTSGRVHPSCRDVDGC